MSISRCFYLMIFLMPCFSLQAEQTATSVEATIDKATAEGRVYIDPETKSLMALPVTEAQRKQSAKVQKVLRENQFGAKVRVLPSGAIQMFVLERFYDTKRLVVDDSGQVSSVCGNDR